MHENGDVWEMIVVVHNEAVRVASNQSRSFPDQHLCPPEIDHRFPSLIFRYGQGRVGVVGDIDVLFPLWQDRMQPRDVVILQARDHERISPCFRRSVLEDSQRNPRSLGDQGPKEEK